MVTMDGIGSSQATNIFMIMFNTTNHTHPTTTGIDGKGSSQKYLLLAFDGSWDTRWRIHKSSHNTIPVVSMDKKISLVLLPGT